MPIKCEPRSIILKYYTINLPFMKNYFCSLFIVGLTTMVSCQNHQINNQEKTNKKNTQRLSGKIFLIGPNIDSANARSYGECDCCTSKVAFINDSEFVAINECMFNNGYYKGHYKDIEDTIKLTSDALYISAEVAEQLSDKNIQKVNLKISRDFDTEHNWTAFTLNNIKCYKTDMDSISFATPDSTNLKSFFEILKSESDSIPKILNVDF
jgi:hypothetical protein